jgi:hypothetical protein
MVAGLLRVPWSSAYISLHLISSQTLPSSDSSVADLGSLSRHAQSHRKRGPDSSTPQPRRDHTRRTHILRCACAFDSGNGVPCCVVKPRTSAGESRDDEVPNLDKPRSGDCDE